MSRKRCPTPPNSGVSQLKPKAPVPLTQEQKEFVVLQLATFHRPGVVRAELKKEFGVDVTRQGIEHYDPTKRAGRKLQWYWSQLFHSTREKFLKNGAAIGASHMVVRIMLREQMVHAAMRKGDHKTANEILDSIAKEVGDAFSNRRKHEHTGADGRPIEIEDAARERIFKRLESLREFVAGGTARLAIADEAGGGPE